MFLPILLFLCLFIFQPSKALAFDPYLCGRYEVNCPLPDCGTCIGPNPGTCAKSVDCPSCSTTSAGCCGDSTPYWSKWKATCKVVEPDIGLCKYIWEYDQFVCSTGDKCVPDETGLRSGYCSCSYGSTYKYCCDTSGNEEECINYYLQDDIFPPEGVCPGGYLIDGNRVRSSPCTGPQLPTNTPIPGQPTNTPVPTNEPTYCTRCSDAGCCTAMECCDSWINVDVPTTAEIGDAVTIRAFQHNGWGSSVGSACNFTGINYYVRGPRNFTFTANNFNIGWQNPPSSIYTTSPVGHWWYNNKVAEAQTPWYTAGYPEGSYEFYDGYYGGHGDNCGSNSACCDETRAGLGGAYTGGEYMRQILNRAPNHRITLTGNYTPSSTCAAGTTPVAVNLSSYNPDFSNPPGSSAIALPWVVTAGSPYRALWSGNYYVTEWDFHSYKLQVDVTGLDIGAEYLVGITGAAASNRICDASNNCCNAWTYPYMKLVSGTRQTEYQKITSTKDWTNFNYSMITKEPWIRVLLWADTHTCWGNVGYGQGAIFDNFRLWKCCNNNPPANVSCRNLVTAIEGNTFTGSWTPLDSASWNNCTNSGNNRYRVYSDISSGGVPNLTTPVGEVSSDKTSYSWDSLVPGNTYFWGVKAVNSEGRESSGFGQICFFTVASPKPWWQTTDGDVHAQGTISSLIPACATTAKYLSLVGPGGNPGVVSWGGGSAPSLENGSISTTKWQANDLNRRPQVGFSYLANRLNLDKSKVFSGDLAATTDGTYYVDASSGTFTFSGDNIGTKKIILFIEGDAKITSNLIVTNGGFFALITKGKIIFDGAVTQATGFFLADGVIDTSVASDAFSGYGSFVAWGGFNLQRDLSNGTTGGCTAAEIFFARPDLYINAPQEFLITPSFFQELAP